ncbi:MAG TPA: hypothetical protein VIT66_09170 [Lysobacter sp.]
MSTEHEGQATSIVVFDGVCVLCNGWVHFLLRHARRRAQHRADIEAIRQAWKLATGHESVPWSRQSVEVSF